MKKLMGVFTIATIAVLSPVGAGTALAATEFGDACQGNGGAPGDFTLTTLSAPPAGLPLTAPSAGVVTKLKVNAAISLPTSFPMTVKVLRPAGGTKYTVISQQAMTASPTGTTTADTRLPVQVGDRLGLHGDTFTFEGSPINVSLYCAGVEGGLGAVSGDAAVGSTVEFFEPAPGRVPLIATIEPDADNDGYGDETQDQCPQSAAVRSACPVAALSVSSIVKKGFARALITSNVQASVTVAGKVKLGKGKTAKLSGGVQVVTPGTIAKFTLIFPSGLKAKLKELSRKQSLQLVLTATAPNIVGTPTVSTLKAKVKGQKKPTHKGKKGGKQG